MNNERTMNCTEYVIKHLLVRRTIYYIISLVTKTKRMFRKKMTRQDKTRQEKQTKKKTLDGPE